MKKTKCPGTSLACTCGDIYSRRVELASSMQFAASLPEAAQAWRSDSSPCKEGSTGLATQQGVSTVNCSRTYFCPHRVARGAGELEAS